MNKLPLRILLLTAFFISYTASADELEKPTHLIEVDRPDSWHFMLAPSLWVPGNYGHVNIDGTRASYSAAMPSNYRDLGAALYAEASKGPLTFMLNPAYTNFRQDLYINNVRARLTATTFLMDGGLYYLLFTKPAPIENTPIASLEILGGGRIASFHSTINNPHADDTSGMLVPIIGARVKYNFCKKYHTWFSGDFGGFKINHVNSTWSATAGISYSLNNNFDLSLAYRAVTVNYSKQVITINTMITGPLLGIIYKW